MNRYSESVRDALVRAGLIESSGSTWFAGFAIGAGLGLAAGAVAAILVTPSTGRDMRRELGSKAKELAHRTQELAQRTQGALSDVSHNVKGKLNERTERYRQEHDEIPIG